MASSSQPPALPLLRHPAEIRQVGIIAVYMGLLFSMYFLPVCRNPVFFVAACYFSFLNSVVIHNHLHQGVFHSRRLNMIWRAIISFGALYPASANIASHNLVHHHFDDDGQPDWAAPENVGFRWHLLNLLHFPPNTDQTRHAHPSIRLGVVSRGRGTAHGPTWEQPLMRGDVFLLDAHEVHAFRTEPQSGMDVIAFHPDSDWGPTDQAHPMKNRTYLR